MSDARQVLLAFASGSEDLIPEFLERFRAVAPALDILVVSEFPPPQGRWIPWKLGRSYEENRTRILSDLNGAVPAWVAVISQPRQPFWAMRRLAVALGRHRTLVFNENLDHVRLHPRSAISILQIGRASCRERV